MAVLRESQNRELKVRIAIQEGPRALKAQRRTQDQQPKLSLIFVSLLEHRAEILTDRGINDKAPDNFWKIEVDQIISGIKENRPAQALCEVIGEIGNKLAENFPPREDDQNELPNQVSLGHRQIEKKDDSKS